MRRLLSILVLATACFAQQPSDFWVVVGNPAQPVQQVHSNTIQEAIRRAGPLGTVWIPATYTGTDCNPLSSCTPGTTLIVDLRGGTFTTFPAGAGSGNVSGSTLDANIPLIGAGATSIQKDTAHVIARTGTDINTSDQVTATHLSAALPIAQGGLNSTATPSTGNIPLFDGTKYAPNSVSGNGSLSSLGVLTVNSLNGLTFPAPGPIGGGTPSTSAFTTGSYTGQVTSTLATGTSPFAVSSKTPVSNLAVEAVGGAIGPITGTAAPRCIVDGVINANIQACITKLTALGFSASGTIETFVPEDITTNIFAINNFRGKVIFNHQMGAAAQSICTTSAPFTCWLLEVPLVLPTHLVLEGVGNPARTQGGFMAGSVISFGTSYPAPMGTSATPTITCSTTGGSLADGVYFFQVWQINNLLGLANNANANSTPGFGGASVEVSIDTTTVNAGACAGGTTHSFSFTMPSAQGSGQFIGQDLEVAGATTSGAEEAIQRGANLTCPNGAGAVDTDACLIAGGGTVVIKALNTAGTRNPPPLVDLSNEMFTLGTGVPIQAANAFNVRLQHLTLSCMGGGTNNNTPTGNEPASAVNDFLAQEQSGLEDVTFTGPCSQNYIYSGYKGGNSTLKGIHMPSNDGPNTGTFIQIIVDGRGGGNGGAREISDITPAARCSGGGTCTGSPTEPESILLTGAKVGVAMHAIHLENDAGGDGILITNGASAFIGSVTGFADTGKFQIHISSTADKVCAFVTKTGQNGAIKDDVTGYASTPPANVGDAYCNQQAIGALKVANGLTMSGTSGAQTTISTSATNANLFFAPNGTGAVVFPDGLVATPGMVGTTSTSSGFYWAGGSKNFMCFATAGAGLGCNDSNGFRLASTGVLRMTNGAVTGTLDTGMSRGTAGGVIAMGNGTAGDKTAKVEMKRATYDGGTTVVAGDFVPSANWGNTASVGITLATSKDGAAVITVTSSGTGQGANPTVAYTFHDGTWSNTPACEIHQTGGTGAMQFTPVTARSATAYTWQWTGTPVAASTYEFTIQCTGT